MAKHEPTMTWITRLAMDKPYQEVGTLNEKSIGIAFFLGNKQGGFRFTVSRKDARLLAKRINQCLDATVTK